MEKYTKRNKLINEIAQTVLLKDTYNLITNGVDFLITHFHKIGEFLDQESIEYIRNGTFNIQKVLDITNMDYYQFYQSYLLKAFVKTS